MKRNVSDYKPIVLNYTALDAGETDVYCFQTIFFFKGGILGYEPSILEHICHITNKRLIFEIKKLGELGDVLKQGFKLVPGSTLAGYQIDRRRKLEKDESNQFLDIKYLEIKEIGVAKLIFGRSTLVKIVLHNHREEFGDNCVVFYAKAPNQSKGLQGFIKEFDL